MNRFQRLFHHPDCPAWANYISVDSRMIGIWWKCEPRVDPSSGLFRSEDDVFKPIHSEQFTQEEIGILVKKEAFDEEV